MKPDDDKELKQIDAVLAGMRDEPSDVPSALMARVLADAQEVRLQTKPTRKPAPFFARLRTNMGGWPAMSGLVAASFFGVLVGLGAPESTLEAVGLADTSVWEEYENATELSGFGWDVPEIQ